LLPAASKPVHRKPDEMLGVLLLNNRATPV
jgi:hypothetical protein